MAVAAPPLRKFRYKNVLPPGGMFFYYVEETDTYFENRVFDNLVREVQTHLSSNDLHVPIGLADLVEHYTCVNVPSRFCIGEPSPDQIAHLSLSKVRDFTKVMAGIGYAAARGVSETKLVDQAEANRRGAICQVCKFNDQKHCTTCTGMKAFAKILTGRRKTDYDDVVGNCAKCGCSIQVKLWIKLSVLRNTTHHQYPNWCWLHPNHISPATEMSNGSGQ